MTDKSKPWLAAKTAGDALLEAHAHVSHKGYASWCDFEAACVIEWHEAQRKKVSEKWEVLLKFNRKGEVWQMSSTYSSRESALVRVTNTDAYSMKVVKVTRYLRKKGAKR